MALLAAPAGSPPASEPVTFENDVKPIVGRCTPCHFPGGVKYADLPFDDPAVVRRLGERLFTRIKDEKERAVLRKFFASSHD